MSSSIFGSGDPIEDPWALPVPRTAVSSAMDSSNSWRGYDSHLTDPLANSFGNMNVSDEEAEEDEPIRDPLGSRSEDEDEDAVPVKKTATGEADISHTTEVWSAELADSFNPLNYHNSTDKMIIKVKEIPEKEGLVFKHINYLITHNIQFPREYQVQQERGELKVVRRYSDFAWLIEVLWKKYPFRIVPDLPPKKFTSEYFTRFAPEGRY